MESQEEIKYNNPRNEIDSRKINALKENLLNVNLPHNDSSDDDRNLQLPELKFSWLWLLFGVPFFIDLYRYVKQLKQLYINHQERIKKYEQKVTQLEQKTITQQELIDKYFDGQSSDIGMNNNIKKLKFDENKYENELISKENKIKELKVKLKYLNRLNKQKDKRIEILETELGERYKKLCAIANQSYKRHFLHKGGKYDEFPKTKSVENINYHGMNEYIRNEDDTFDIKPIHANTTSDENDFLI